MTWNLQKGINLAVDASSYTANCAPFDNVGDLVCITGDRVNNFLQVLRADIDDPLRMPAVGMIIAKPSLTICRIQPMGNVSADGIDPGKIHYVGSDGRPTSIRPPNPTIGERLIQSIGIGLASDLLLLSPSPQMTVIVP